MTSKNVDLSSGENAFIKYKDLDASTMSSETSLTTVHDIIPKCVYYTISITGYLRP